MFSDTKLCENMGADFKQNILKSTLAFEQYEEIFQIKKDIRPINVSRKKLLQD